MIDQIFIEQNVKISNFVEYEIMYNLQLICNNFL